MATTIQEIKIEELCNELREKIKEISINVRNLMLHRVFEEIKQNYIDQHDEMKANIMLTYRHLEDARMRVGKILQAAGDGISILDE